mgnify:CR=1 FL=1|tara:strand:- start:89 stop:355 length:267 start_codon:yes stop_codon:yes gene_type:complete
MFVQAATSKQLHKINIMLGQLHVKATKYNETNPKTMVEIPKMFLPMSLETAKRVITALVDMDKLFSDIEEQNEIKERLEAEAKGEINA